MLLFAGLGVVLTAASVELTGEMISDPINLIGRIDSDIGVVIAMIMIILATISTNTAANIVSPTNVFQNVAPKIINERSRRDNHRPHRPGAHELGAPEKTRLARNRRQRRKPVLELAARLFEPARADRGYHGRRLLPDQESGVQSDLRSTRTMPVTRPGTRRGSLPSLSRWP